MTCVSDATTYVNDVVLKYELGFMDKVSCHVCRRKSARSNELLVCTVEKLVQYTVSKKVRQIVCAVIS